MPYRSEKQRGWMHVHEPEIAERWDKEYGGKVVRKAAEAAKKVGQAVWKRRLA